MRVSGILALFGASLALAAPTATKPTSYEPTFPEPYGPEHSVSYKPWKRHIAAEERAVEEPATLTKRDASATYPEPYPEHSVDHKPWKRHLDADLTERTERSLPFEYGPPEPYPSGGAYHYERDVPVMEAPEHFELLTA